MENSELEEINLLDYLHVLIKRRRMIVRNTFVAAVVMAVVSLLLPKYYTATTTLLPPDDSDQQGLRGLLANAPVSFINLPGLSATSSEIFQEILKSRTVAEGVLITSYDFEDKKMDLFEFWQIDLKTDAIKKLRQCTKISTNEQGIIQIDVEVREPELAAEVAKAYVAELDRVNREKSFSKAKNSRIYIEEQLKLTESNLARATQAQADFQIKFKAVDLEQQTKVAIEKAGEIKGTIMAREIELEVARQTMKPGNPAIIRLQKELEELRKQFEHLQFGNSVPFEQQRDYFIPFADVPEIGLRFADLVREVKVQETVWQLLNQQYYSMKIQEARDTPTVQVLDEAVPPEKRSSPKRALLVVIASFLMFGVCIFAAFVLEFAEKVRENEEDYRKARDMADELKQDYRATKSWFKKYFNR